MWNLSHIDEDRARLLAADIEKNGYTCLTNVVPAEALLSLKEYVSQVSQQHGGQYFAYHGVDKFQGSLLASLAQDQCFNRLLATMYRLDAHRSASSGTVFPVLRCVQGTSGQKESNAFHFDASLVTVLIPIFIPEEGEQRGDLIMFPNLRKIRSSVWLNVIEKIILQNRITRAVIGWGMRRGWLKPMMLRIVPGNIYLFWGYRSLHANQPCDPAFRRATALIHFGDPHSGSFTTRWILKLNQRRARLAAQRRGQMGV